jgi:fibronectin type 3 domain-containing protein
MHSLQSLAALAAAVGPVVSGCVSKITSPGRRHRMRRAEVSLQALEVRTLFSDYNYFDLNNSTLPQGDLYEGDELSMNLHVVDQDYNPDFFPQVYVGFGEYDPQAGNVGYNVDITGTEQDVAIDHVYQNNASFGAALYLWDTQDTYSLNIFNRQPQGTASYTIDDDNGGDMLYTIDGSDISPVDMDAGLRFSFAYTYAGLAGTYWSASASSSFTYDPEQDDDGVFYGRVFDCDGGFCDIPVNAPMIPTLNWDEVHHNSVRFSWDPSVAQNQEQHWIVQRAPDVAGHPGSWETQATLDAGSDHYTDGAVSPATRYWYRVRAQGTPGTAGDTGYSAKQAITTLVQTPSPTGQTASRAPGTNDITISWTGEAGDTFNVYRNGVGGTLVYSGQDHTYTDYSTKTPQSGYTYQIIATKAGQDDSDYVQATAYTMPTTPTGLEAFVVSGTEVQLYWDDTNPNVRYRVYRGPSSEFEPDDYANFIGYTDQDHYEDTTVSPNIPYYYKLEAEWVGLANSLPTEAVEADTHTTYEPTSTDFDDEFAPDTEWSGNVDGEYTIDFYNSSGAIVSFAIAPPADADAPYVLGTDYSYSVDPATNTLKFDFVTPGPYAIQVVRTRAGVEHSEGIGAYFQTYAMGTQGGSKHWHRIQDVPLDGLIFVTEASGVIDPPQPKANGGIEEHPLANVRSYYAAYSTLMGNYDDVVDGITSYYTSNFNTKMTVSIIDHGIPGAINMGSGGSYSPIPGSFIDATNNVGDFTSGVAGKVNDIFIYECGMANAQGAALMQQIANSTGATVYAYDGGPDGIRNIGVSYFLGGRAWFAEDGVSRIKKTPQS